MVRQVKRNLKSKHEAHARFEYKMRWLLLMKARGALTRELFSNVFEKLGVFN